MLSVFCFILEKNPFPQSYELVELLHVSPLHIPILKVPENIICSKNKAHSNSTWLPLRPELIGGCLTVPRFY